MKTDYLTYLASPAWKRIRLRVLKRDKHHCQSCGRRAWQVHHSSYDPDTMAGRRLDRLHSMCGRCHLEISFDRWGVAKRPFQEQVALSKELGFVRGKGAKPKQHRLSRGERRRRRKERGFSTDMRPRVRGIEAIRALSKEYAEGRMK